MKKSIFGVPRHNGGIRLDPFFIETALIIPVFAVCCCGILRILGTAADRADHEQTYAAAVACAESWCELYGASGSLELSAEELFGKQAAECCISGMNMAIPTDDLFTYSPKNSSANVFISETIEECITDGLVYGQLFSSDIRIVWDNGEISERAVHYSPYPVVIPAETEESE
ncbi:MAG: hypothetical protein J6K92_08095 [Oscillospiraceae bacterium]|nr:hypothetical protein [Oscillospiraceae bacterium]